MSRPLVALCLALASGWASAQSWAPVQDPLSVHHRRILPKEPQERLDWDQRIAELLKREPGDLIVTAVGDLIFNEPLTHLKEPERAGLFRLMQEADVAYGNMEFSLNDRPDLQRPFYNFRAPKSFRWELARTGINMVSLANNHSLDFGPEGLKECLQALEHANIATAGAGETLAEARELGLKKLAGFKSTAGLLAYMRYWTAKYRSRNPAGPSLATIDPATILVARDGKVEAVEGPLEADVKAMEDDILLARRRTDLLMVALHNHDVTHHRAHGIQDVTPASCSTGPSRPGPTWCWARGPTCCAASSSGRGGPSSTAWATSSTSTAPRTGSPWTSCTSGTRRCPWRPAAASR